MEETPGTVYTFSAPLLDGSVVCLDRFHGHVMLIVNTASRCGFTPQYVGLEQLFQAYKGRGFVVLGFPCNQFGEQEPGTASEIERFCQQSYGISFPIFAKIDVNGANTHPLFRFLKKSKTGIFGTARIKWNFTKFLIGRSGKVERRYAPSKGPMALASDLERLLEER
jgi:glutathione peroxidase